ncbi:MAG: lipoyl(octanoyl) transferase LipB [Gemmatimonadaceae bacterium]
MKEFLVVDLGLRSYAEALAFQREAAAARIERRLTQDLLILVEHPPVITLGRSTKAGHLLATKELLDARGVELFEVERGGDVTFHGPGQLVGYPIVDLTEHRQDLHWFLRQVEEVVIRAVAPFGIVAARNPGKTGVWTRDRKLASIGVHARQWVTWHGFALNVTTDLSYFDLMVPCGIADVTMTSVEREILAGADGVCWAAPPGLGAEARAAAVRAFGDVFERAPLAVHELDVGVRL